ncbi:oligosaccharide flippase family protein [bacterium]|nr:oligosaccharide flippase family protein [bacterium]
MKNKILNKNENLSESLKALARGTGVSFIFGILGCLIVFLFKLISARYLGPEEYGLYEMIQTILMISIVISLFGISSGIPRFIPLYKKRKQVKLLSGYLNFIFKTPLFISLAVCLILFIFSPKITAFFDFPDKFTLLIKIVIFAIPFKTINQIIQNVFISKKKVFFQTFAEDFLEKVLFLLSIVMVYFFNLSLLYAVFFLTLSIFVVFVFNLYVLKSKIKLRVSKKIRSEKKEWLLFSTPLFFSSFFALIIQWSDNVMIGKILDAKSLGIYAIAFSLASFATLLRRIVVKIIMPFIAEHYSSNNSYQIKFMYKKASAWIFQASFFIFITIAVLGKNFLRIFYGKSYEEGYITLILISAGFAIFTAFGINEPFLILYKKTKSIFKVDFSAAILNILLNMILIPIFGINGSATATSLTRVGRGVFNMKNLSKMDSFSIDYLMLSKTVASGIVTAMIPFFLTFNFEINFLCLFLLGMFMFIAYSFFLFFFKVIDSEDKKIIYAVLRKLKLLVKK